MSVAVTAVARVSVTAVTLIAGDVPAFRETVPSVPPAGVFFTVKAELARELAAPSASLKVSVSAVPETAALDSVGRTVSTVWSALAASAAWVSVAAFEDESPMVPPLSASASARP